MDEKAVNRWDDGTVSKLGSPEHPLLLHTAMFNVCQTPITVSCGGPIKIKDGKSSTIRSAFPVTLEIKFDDTFDIIPAVPLNSSFREGWYKLPDEIKLMILSFAGDTIYETDDNEMWDVFKYSDVMDIPNSVLAKFLRCRGDIARLGREAFYRVHTFQVCLDEHKFFYPKQSVNQFIRYLEIKVGVYLEYDQWRKLKDLAAGSYGFGNLKYIELIVVWDWDSIANAYDEYDIFKNSMDGGHPPILPREPIQFNSRGTVSDDYHDVAFDPQDAAKYEVPIRVYMEKLRNLVQFRQE
ncbi:unnamed protein product [Periconia digitata]|uniref:Uncharacterized protein n=1 Tax=Periconia digitata TaxID=1303443 RepID=A0A9W4UC06_9PLEO|nr:unnamed protein product [Periconia digitata]